MENRVYKNLKDSKKSEASPVCEPLGLMLITREQKLLGIVSKMHKSYQTGPLGGATLNPYGPGSVLFFFTVTPKGRNRRFRDYLPQFRKAVHDLKVVNFCYYVRQRTNTRHLHGVISVSNAKYKFVKLTTDLFTFDIDGKMRSLRLSCRYMLHENPKTIYYLKSIRMLKNCHTSHLPKGHPLKVIVTKEIYTKIKL